MTPTILMKLFTDSVSWVKFGINTLIQNATIFGSAFESGEMRIRITGSPDILRTMVDPEKGGGIN